MAKAIHVPMGSSTAGSVKGPRWNRSVSPQVSVEDLGAHLHESLALFVMPQLCKPCQRTLNSHLACSYSSRYSPVFDPVALDKRESGHQNKQQPSPPDRKFNKSPSSSALLDCICRKCRSAILGKLRTNDIKAGRPTSAPQLSSCPIKATHGKVKGKERPPSPSTAAYLADMIRSVFARFYPSASSHSSTWEPTIKEISSGIASPIMPHSPSSSSMYQRNFYQQCTQQDKSWCRFCGTTETSRWGRGPWGPKTVCFRHSGSYRGELRVTLDGFANEGHKRGHPIVRDYCAVCWTRLDIRSSCMRCAGCPFAYHMGCIPQTARSVQGRWFCHAQRCLQQLEALSADVRLPDQALMPFCDIEVVSDTGDVPALLGASRKGPLGPEDDRSPSKRRQSSSVMSIKLPPGRKGLEQKESIPIPGVTRHPVPAYLRANTDNGHPRAVEKLEDHLYLERHKRYETAEMQSRICRPQVLKKLMSQRHQLHPPASKPMRRRVST